MKLIQRLKRITMPRIEAFLKSLEDPELILPQLLKEIEKYIISAAGAEAKSLNAVKSAKKRFDETSGKIMRLKEGAALAVKSNQIDLARQAIAAQIGTEKNMAECKRELEKAEIAYQNARHAKIQLQNNLHKLKEKKTDLIRQSRIAKITKRANPASDDILETVARMEAKVETAQAEMELRDEISKTLGPAFNTERIRQLEKDSEVDRRLEEIRNKLA